MVARPARPPGPRRVTAPPEVAKAGTAEAGLAEAGTAEAGPAEARAAETALVAVVPVARAPPSYTGGVITAQAATAAQRASCRERMVNLR